MPVACDDHRLDGILRVHGPNPVRIAAAWVEDMDRRNEIDRVGSIADSNREARELELSLCLFRIMRRSNDAIASAWARAVLDAQGYNVDCPVDIMPTKWREYIMSDAAVMNPRADQVRSKEG